MAVGLVCSVRPICLDVAAGAADAAVHCFRRRRADRWQRPPCAQLVRKECFLLLVVWDAELTGIVRLGKKPSSIVYNVPSPPEKQNPPEQARRHRTSQPTRITLNKKIPQQQTHEAEGACAREHSQTVFVVSVSCSLFVYSRVSVSGVQLLSLTFL